jgi:hypothetical protein
VIVAAATLYTAILYGSTSFLMLFYVELLLPVLLFFTLIPARKGMRISLSLPVPVVQQGDTVSVFFHAGQKIPFPGGRIGVRVVIHPPLQKKSEKTWFYFSVSSEGRRWKVRRKGSGDFADTPVMKAAYSAKYAGNVTMEIDKVWCSDLLGIIAVPAAPECWKSLEPAQLLVLPKMCEMPVAVSRQSRDFVGESTVYSKEKGGDDASEIFRIREYQPGDKLRSIHWKISAKTGDVMVREQSLPLGCPVDLFLDCRSVPGRKKEKSQKRDSYFQAAASISHSLVREGCRHYVIWYDEKQQDIFRFLVQKEEDIYEALLRMGHMEPQTAFLDLPELYRRKYHDVSVITRLELRMDLTLWQNGTVIRKYKGTTEALEKQLRETELVV